jgi:hypothetical protein
MINLIKKLMLVYSYGQEIEDVLKNQRNATAEKKKLEAADNLQLCPKHKQEETMYRNSPDNCHYCRLKRKCASLEKTLEVHHYKLRQDAKKSMAAPVSIS